MHRATCWQRCKQDLTLNVPVQLPRNDFAVIHGVKHVSFLLRLITESCSRYNLELSFKPLDVTSRNLFRRPYILTSNYIKCLSINCFHCDIAKTNFYFNIHRKSGFNIHSKSFFCSKWGSCSNANRFFSLIAEVLMHIV